MREWDLALKTAVQTARLVECRKTGTGGGDRRLRRRSSRCGTASRTTTTRRSRISRDVDACRRTQRLGRAAPARDLAAHQAAAAVAERARRDRGDRRARWPSVTMAAMPPVIVLCHNPVMAGDHPACGAAGLAPRLGDIRYNTVLNIAKPQAAHASGASWSTPTIR